MAKRRIPRINKTSAKKFGNWDGVISYMGRLGHNVKGTAQEAQKTEALKIVERVKAHINQQDLPWAPLSDSYRRRKNAAYRDSIYINTTTYLDSIRVWKEGNTYFAGIKKGISYRNRQGKKVTVEAVARWMEYGTRKTPARPLWSPTFKEVGGAYGIRNRIARAIYNKVKATKPKEITVTFRDIRTKVPR